MPELGGFSPPQRATLFDFALRYLNLPSHNTHQNRGKDRSGDVMAMADGEVSRPMTLTNFGFKVAHKFGANDFPDEISAFFITYLEIQCQGL